MMTNMKRWIAVSVVCSGIGLLAGCGKQTPPAAATGQNATVTLKDGTSFAGSVTGNSTSEITLKAPNGETRTYPMAQVDSVQYSQAAAPPPLASATPAPTSTPANVPPATPAPVASAPVSPAPTGTANLTGTDRRTVPAQAAEPRERTEPVVITRVVPAGSTLVVRNNERIDSSTAAPGQTYSAVISQDVFDTGGRVLIPRGSNATMVVRSATSQGRVQGQSELALDLATVSVGGRRYRVETADIVRAGHAGLGKNKRTAGFVGGGTALGALLGAVAGGGKGAAIGALSGAAAGTATQTLTRGRGVNVPSETVLTFRLEAPIRIRQTR